MYRVRLELPVGASLAASAGRRVFSPPRRKDVAAPHSANLCGKSRRHPAGRKLVRRIGHMLHIPGYGPPFRRRRGRSMLTHAMVTVLGAALASRLHLAVGPPS